jgi:hypothetical protein
VTDVGFAACGLARASAERVARRIAGPAAQLDRCEAVPIVHRVIRETTDALFRVVLHVRATPAAAGGVHEVVVKRMRADSPTTDPHREQFLPSEEPHHPNYWLREFEVYGASLLDALPSPLRIPKCYERERDARTSTVWLEAIPSDAPATWDDDRFAAIAHALGAWQGAFAARGDALAAPAWLARGALAMWSPAVGGSAYAAAHGEALLGSPYATAAFGRAGVRRVTEVWTERGAACELLDRAPRTLAHGDLWTRNLLALRDSSAAVAVIDWSELGIAPVAHDLVNLVLDSVWMFDVPPDRIAAIERAALDSYARGWVEARGEGPPATIEVAYRANAAVRFGTLAGVLLRQAGDETKRTELTERYGRPFEQIFDARAAVLRAALRVKT